jgi:hypothetical protein
MGKLRARPLLLVREANQYPVRFAWMIDPHLDLCHIGRDRMLEKWLVVGGQQR